MAYRYVRLQDGRTELAWVNDPVPFNWSQVTPRSLAGTAIIVAVFIFAGAVGHQFGPAGFLDVLKAFGALWLCLVLVRVARRVGRRH